MTALLVCLGGSAGAVLRHLVDHVTQGRLALPVPAGTLVVNTTGSLVLGFVYGAAPHAAWLAPLVGAGFCGALTTFSAFSLQTLHLVERGAHKMAALTVVGGLSTGIAAAAAGLALAEVLL